MKKLICLIVLIIPLVGVSQNLDSLHNLIKSEINDEVNRLNSKIDADKLQYQKSENALRDSLNHWKGRTQSMQIELNSSKTRLSNSEKQVKRLWKKDRKANSERKSLKDSIDGLNSQIVELTTALMSSESGISGLSSKMSFLNAGVDSTEALLNQQSGQLQNTQNRSNQFFNYTIYGLLALLLVILLVYYLVNKRSKSISQEVLQSATELKEAFLAKHTGLAENMSKLLEGLKESPTSGIDNVRQIVLDTAAEFIEMENNIIRMDPDVRGLKQIKRAIKNIRSNLASMDYEVPYLLNEAVTIGQNIDINKTVYDESVELGKCIVTRVVRPQVLYSNKEIQKARVDVKMHPDT